MNKTPPSANWNNLNRRIDEVFGMLKLLQDENERQAAASAAATGDRGLFVIGHARSGTTILADVLNTSDDVCCLVEPYFHRSVDVENFAESFNSMHRGFGNPPIKGGRPRAVCVTSPFALLTNKCRQTWQGSVMLTQPPMHH